MIPLIEARRLARNFSVTPVLRAVDLKLQAGRVAIVTGINGAGKSTLLELLAGLSQPSAGRALLFGQDSSRLSAGQRRRVGVMTHQSFLYPNLTARENLEFYASLYGLSSPPVVARRWLEAVDLLAAADERVRALSRGMEQRLSAARAMLAEPDALLMDEPFAGLDAKGISILSHLVSNAIARGCAAVITAHGYVTLEGIDVERLELSKGLLLPAREQSRSAAGVLAGAPTFAEVP